MAISKYFWRNEWTLYWGFLCTYRKLLKLLWYFKVDKENQTTSNANSTLWYVLLEVFKKMLYGHLSVMSVLSVN